jgi:hypothetical protein
LSLSGYLGLFRLRRAELLDRGEVSEHPASAAATIGLALARLEERAPGAAGLLRLLACLASEPVPVGLLLSAPGLADGLDPEVAVVLGPLLGDPLATADAIAALRRYSLITLARDGMMLVHRLVQAVTVSQVPAEVADRWRQAAAVVTEAAVPDDPALPSTWPACAALLPHAMAVLDPTSDGMWRIAIYVGESGGAQTARELFRRIADAHERADAHGAGHRDTLAARHNLAAFTGQAGDAAGARDLLAALLPDMRRVLGPEHADTLTTRGSGRRLSVRRCSGRCRSAARTGRRSTRVFTRRGGFSCAGGWCGAPDAGGGWRASPTAAPWRGTGAMAIRNGTGWSRAGGGSAPACWSHSSPTPLSRCWSG